jgi:hypothetical protein
MEITSAFLFAHTLEIRVALAVLAIGLGFAIIGALNFLADLATSLRSRAGDSQSAQLSTVGAR